MVRCYFGNCFYSTLKCKWTRLLYPFYLREHIWSFLGWYFKHLFIGILFIGLKFTSLSYIPHSWEISTHPLPSAQSYSSVLQSTAQEFRRNWDFLFRWDNMYEYWMSPIPRLKWNSFVGKHSSLLASLPQDHLRTTPPQHTHSQFHLSLFPETFCPNWLFPST